MSIAQLVNVSVASRKLPEGRALNNVSMSFGNGKFSAVLGPNGSSKSLLIEVLGGLAPISTGQVITCGIDITHSGNDELAELRASSVSYVFNKHNVIDTLTIRENLLLAHTFSSLHLDNVLYRDVIGSFNLRKYLDLRPSATTADVHQRVAIARAVLKRSRLILAHEPTQFLRQEPSENVLIHYGVVTANTACPSLCPPTTTLQHPMRITSTSFWMANPRAWLPTHLFNPLLSLKKAAHTGRDDPCSLSSSSMLWHSGEPTFFHQSSLFCPPCSSTWG